MLPNPLTKWGQLVSMRCRLAAGGISTLPGGGGLPRFPQAGGCSLDRLGGLLRGWAGTRPPNGRKGEQVCFSRFSSKKPSRPCPYLLPPAPAGFSSASLLCPNAARSSYAAPTCVPGSVYHTVLTSFNLHGQVALVHAFSLSSLPPSLP